MVGKRVYTTLALFVAVPLLALGLIQGFAANNPGQANVPVITLTYVSSSSQFPVPINNQGYSPTNATVIINGQQKIITLQPYSYTILNVSLNQGANVIQLGRERLLVTYNYSSNAVNPIAYINGSKQVIVVQNVKPGSYLYFTLTANLPGSSYYLQPEPPFTDMEAGIMYSAYYAPLNTNSKNVVNYAVYVPPGISQGLYQVYFPVYVVGPVKTSGGYALEPVGFTWAVAFINVTYGLTPFSQTNSTKPMGSGELAQFVIPNFNATKTYYLTAGSQVYQIGPQTTSFNVYGYSGSTTYYGSSQVEVAYSSNGMLVYIPNYQGPVSLSTSPSAVTTTTTTTATSTSTTTSSTTTTTSTTSTTTTTSSTSTTTTTSTTSALTQTSSTNTTTTNTTTTVVVPSTTIPVSSVTPSATATSPSFQMTYAIIGAIIVVVIVVAIALLLRK